MVSWSAPNLLEAKVALLDGKIGLAAKMEDEETGDAWINLARDVFPYLGPQVRKGNPLF